MIDISSLDRNESFDFAFWYDISERMRIVHSENDRAYSSYPTFTMDIIGLTTKTIFDEDAGYYITEIFSDQKFVRFQQILLNLDISINAYWRFQASSTEDAEYLRTLITLAIW